MTTLVNALLGLTDAVSHLAVELRLQRVAIAKLGAQRELDKEATEETFDELGRRVVQQEGRVGRLELVRPERVFPPDEPPTRPDGPKPARPHIPKYPRRP